MIDFSLSAEQDLIRETAKDFANSHLLPGVMERDDKSIFPIKEIQKLGELGFMGMMVPEKWGGSGLDTVSYTLAIEEISAVELSTSTIMSVNNSLVCQVLMDWGNNLQKKKYLIPLASGKKLGAYSLSEPDSGSDARNMQTFAERDGDDYIINGQKMWITNATQADFFCALINTGDGLPHKNKSLIIIPADTTGLKIGEKIDKLGLKSSDTAPIYFDDVRVPQEYRIGLEGEGFTMQMQQFQEERIFLSASCLVMLDESIKQTIDYCKDRKAFGGQIIDNQSIQFKLAELQTEIESLRSLVYRACEEFIELGDMTYLASMAKLKSGRLLRETADSCLQYWGGMGFTWENPLSKVYRDGRLMSIGGGTDEIMLSIICKHLGMTKK